MPGYGAFQFASPQNYGDWTQYAGMDRTTGEIQGVQPAQQGVAPPENFGQMLEQRMAPAQKVFNAVAPALGQAGSGNFAQALGTMRTARTPAPQQQGQIAQPTIDHSYDYTHGLE